jgi:uncharacterized protein YbaR (Trm112 family)
MTERRTCPDDGTELRIIVSGLEDWPRYAWCDTCKRRFPVRDEFLDVGDPEQS